MVGKNKCGNFTIVFTESGGFYVTDPNDHILIDATLCYNPEQAWPIEIFIDHSSKHYITLTEKQVVIGIGNETPSNTAA